MPLHPTPGWVIFLAPRRVDTVPSEEPVAHLPPLERTSLQGPLRGLGFAPRSRRHASEGSAINAPQNRRTQRVGTDGSLVASKQFAFVVEEPLHRVGQSLVEADRSCVSKYLAGSRDVSE